MCVSTRVGLKTHECIRRDEALRDELSHGFIVALSQVVKAGPSLPFVTRCSKYFWEWLAIRIAPLLVTKFLDMLFQSPFPFAFSPTSNNLP